MKDESQRDKFDALCLPRTFQGPVVPCLFKSPQDCAASMKARVRTGAAPQAQRQQMKLREMSESATVAHNKHPRSNEQLQRDVRSSLSLVCTRKTASD